MTHRAIGGLEVVLSHDGFRQLPRQLLADGLLGGQLPPEIGYCELSRGPLLLVLQAPLQGAALRELDLRMGWVCIPDDTFVALAF